MNMVSKESKKVTSDHLQGMVDQFNNQFQKWMADTGCRANFGWKYGKEDSIKQLEIQGIDVIVYRKPAPNFSGEPAVQMDRNV